MNELAEYGNTWAVLPQTPMLIFICTVIVFAYYLGFYFGMKLESELEKDREPQKKAQPPKGRR